MGYMKKMWLEMLLEPRSPYEPPNKYSILEKAIESAIEDLEKSQSKGVVAAHRRVLIWSALNTLKTVKEKCNEKE
jgi:hypothetical protein